MKFEKAISKILSHEGGYVNDPSDRGGETKFGLSDRADGKIDGEYFGVDISEMTREEAIKLYHNDYWNRCKCDELPDGVDYLVFDTAVNMGLSAAIKILQKAAGSTQDGIIGPKTIAAATKMSPELYIIYRYDRYMRIIGGRPTNAKFAKGWSNRLLDVLKVVS